MAQHPHYHDWLRKLLGLYYDCNPIRATLQGIIRARGTARRYVLSECAGLTRKMREREIKRTFAVLILDYFRPTSHVYKRLYRRIYGHAKIQIKEVKHNGKRKNVW